MDLPAIKTFLFWCVVINYGVLFLWFVVFLAGHELLYRLHGRLFRLPVETFDAIHYGAMAVYKIGILLFFLVPLLALMAAGH